MESTNFESPQSPMARFSKLSIAALAISIVGFLLFCTAIAVAFGIGALSNGQPIDQRSPTFIVATLLMCGGLLIDLLGAGLSVGSLFVVQESKVISIIGIVLGGLVVCMFGALVILGLVIA